jgi:hypothetical protein
MKKVLAGILAVGLAFSFAGCKKEEKKPQLPAGHPSMEGGMPPMGGAAPDMPKVDRKVVVPKEVTARWKAVRIAVEDKAAKSTKEYVIPVGGEQAVPNTNYTIKVLYFLPDFRMADKDITSASDKPNNPAAQVVVTEGGKEIAKAWLFAMNPGIHPFQHEKLGLTLAGGVAK